MSVRAGWQQGRATGAGECDVKSEDMAGCQMDTSRTRHSLPAPSVPSAAVTVPQEPRAGQARCDRDGGTATTAHASFCHLLVLLFGTPGWEQRHTSPLPVQTHSLKPSAARSGQGRAAVCCGRDTRGKSQGTETCVEQDHEGQRVRDAAVPELPRQCRLGPVQDHRRSSWTRWAIAAPAPGQSSRGGAGSSRAPGLRDTCPHRCPAGRTLAAVPGRQEHPQPQDLSNKKRK